MPSLHVDDPGGLGLRRAARVAVVLPVAVLAARVLGPPAAVTYAAFGSFALVVLADFGGPVRRRVRAYLGAGAAGAVLVPAGVLAGQHVATAAAAGLAVGAGVGYVSLLRGYVAAAGPSVQLAFVLSVCLGAPPGDVPAMLAGWALAVALATPAAVLLWPGSRRGPLRLRLADGLRAAAEVVQARWDDGAAGRWGDGGAGAADPPVTRRDVAERDGRGGDGPDAAGPLGALVAAVDRADAEYGGKPLRPAGATARDRGLMLLLDELRRIRTLCVWATTDRPPRLRAGDGCPADPVLARATAGQLRAAAEAVTGRPPPSGLGQLLAVRDAHREATDAWLSSPDRPADPDEVLDRLGRTHPLRVVSLLAAMAALDARASAGLDRDLPGGSDALGRRHTPRTALGTLAAQASWRSPWLRNAVRAGAGVSLGVAVTLLSGVEHGFWVVLGVVSVLRYDAEGTGRTAAQAVAGTVAGFAAGSLAVLAAGGAPAVLAALLPVSAFAAGYAPGRLPVLVGQAAFTVFVLVLFGLLDYPPSLGTGIVRVEDIALGAAVSVAVGLLLWPRGVHAQLAGATAEAYEEGADYLVAAVEALTGAGGGTKAEAGGGTKAEAGGGTDAGTGGGTGAGAAVGGGDRAVRVAQRRADEAAGRAEEVFDLALSQRGPNMPEAGPWSHLANGAGHLVACADLVAALARVGAGPPEGVGAGVALRGRTGEVRDRMRAVAAQLRTPAASRRPAQGTAPQGPAPAGTAPQGPGSLHPELRACARAALDAGAPGARITVLVWAGDWLAHLDWLAGRALVRALLVADGAGGRAPGGQRRGGGPGGAAAAGRRGRARWAA